MPDYFAWLHSLQKCSRPAWRARPPPVKSRAGSTRRRCDRYKVGRARNGGSPMPIAKVRGADINYEVLGTHGPWLSLSPGGRRALDNVKPLAQRMADRGYRVLIHDRRNCGLSDLVIGGDTPEYEGWADRLYALLSQVNAPP